MEFKSSNSNDSGIARSAIEACLKQVSETGYLATDLEKNDILLSKLIHSDSILKKIHTKSQNRCLMDRKVAPGSESVVCSILNSRYLLCLIHINMGKYYELQSDTYDHALACYQKALIWYPKSIEAGHLLGSCLRSRSVSSEELGFVQFLWERAFAASQSLNLVADSHACGDSNAELSGSEQMALGILLSTDVSLSCVSIDPATLSECISQAQTSIIYREREVGKLLLDSLILFYCQENQQDNAFPLLLCKRYQWKLSQQVLTYSSGTTARDARQVALEARSDFPFTFGYDSVLPDQYLRRLQHVFRPSAPFWREHQYDFYSNCSRQVGYFSYLYPFRACGARNVIEQVIDIVYQTVISQLEADEASLDGDSGSGAVNPRGSGRSKNTCLEALRHEATQAEWWVHSRPHTSGHQFHFDSDETALYGGEQPQVATGLTCTPSHHTIPHHISQPTN
jgi:hypothetical protein